ncbi:NAD-dependent epimerase/dehydratase family protein [Enterovirga sp. CN4-39]|uniref:NAD-dependent epimerase/dehydratase family protein n=1 Tax=Enterovirga sp. CN4-39 TaxID=3400910 RepID=UPI003BFFC118
MKVAVTGAAGFVGLNILDALLGRGHEVLALDLGPLRADAVAELPRQDALTVERLNVLDGEQLEARLRDFGCEALFHGASVTASVETEQSDFGRVLEVNVVGTARVLEACRRAGIRRIVAASSSAVYGGLPFGREPVVEDAPLHPLTVYGISKLAAEQSALRFGELHDLEVVVPRIAAVFGRWEWETRQRDVMSPLFQIARDAVRGREVVLPRGGARDWIDVRRVAHAVALLIEAPRLAHPVYNLAAIRTWSPELLCSELEKKMPGFRWRFGEDRDASIDYRDDVTRERQAVTARRVTDEFGLEVLGTPEADAASFAEWAASHPSWFARTPAS